MTPRQAAEWLDARLQQAEQDRRALAEVEDPEHDDGPGR